MSLVDNRFLCLSGGAVITRYFAELDAVQQSHLVYANTLVFGAGDTYEFDVTKNNQTQALFGGDGGSSRCYSHSNGDFELAVSGSATWAGATSSIALGSLYSVSIELGATTVELFIAGISQGTKAFTGGFSVKRLGASNNTHNFYNGIFADAVATISGVTTFNEIGVALLGGNAEPSITTGPANSLQPFFIPDPKIEQFQLSGDTTQWDNISDAPQQLPAVIEIA